jgi:tetratricopeptide (TPR) repeat protein
MLPAPTSLDFLEILAIAAKSGAFGGLVYVCANVSVKGRNILFLKEAAFFWPMMLITGVSIIAGAGSGIGLLFALHFLQLLKDDKTPDNILFLISGCAIAGMAAQRLIPSYTRSLESKISSLEYTAEQSKEAAKDASVLTEAQAAMAVAATRNDKIVAIGKLDEQIAKTPLDRKLIILRGRLLRRINDLPRAIASLEEFVRRKKEAGQKDTDYADVLYNIACYHAQEWSGKKTPEYREKALSNLRESVSIAPSNARDAREDQDFQDLYQDAEFVAITKS